MDYPIHETFPKFKDQKEMFLWIMEQRPWKSDLSGDRLLPYGHFQWHWQFLHVLGKGTYPKWKLNPNNILLGLPDEHSHQEQYEVFQNYKAQLIRIEYEKNYGKEFN